MNEVTDIVVVLDRSGSMQTNKQGTIEGYNTFLGEQQALPGTALWTLVQFDDEYEPQPTDDVRRAPPLNGSTYLPRGNTALLDAIGRTINETRARQQAMDEPPQHTVVVIVTDGQENASREFTTKRKVTEMVRDMETLFGWKFIFLGANMDAIMEGQSLGTQIGTTMSFNNTPQGMRATLGATSGTISGLRTTGNLQSFTSAQRAASMDTNEAPDLSNIVTSTQGFVPEPDDLSGLSKTRQRNLTALRNATGKKFDKHK